MKILRVILAALVLLAAKVNCDSQGVFELRLKNFENALGRDVDGHCCDGFRTRDGHCTGDCSTKFRVCLKHYQKKVDLGQECTFGESVTPVMGNNVVNFDTILFPLDFKWPGTFSLIIEAWHQNNKTSEGNALISRLATQNQLDAGDDWIRGVQQESNTRLEYEYRMVCSEHYFGADCDTLCRPRDDQFGHYTCGEDGEKVCLEGWQKDPDNLEGDYCTKAKCLPGCHPEHGECDRPGQCKCKTGYSGPFCSECNRYPGCVHGSCEKPYECLCDDGWGGLFCNQDLNYCTNHRPCQNGATCRNTGQGSYTCSCTPGWTGTNCESRISNECEHQPCMNGGTCQGSGVNDYMCVCPLGFHGAHCEKEAQKCSDFPCKNGASCRDTSSGYQCQCPAEYQGVNCDVRVDHCRATPCQNGGTCTPTGRDSFECRCPAGFSGPRCEKNVDDCALNPCQNGGTCFDFVDDYKCYCHSGFVGRNCEHNVNDCLTNPCANGGTCHDAINDFVCTCRPGFTGKDCSVEVNECAKNPCLHGFCIDKMNDFECKCLPGYSGKHCNVLPNGTVLKITGADPDDLGGDQKLTIIVCSTLVPLLVLIAALWLWCNKRRQRMEQRRSDAEAKRENELNAINCVNKTKMLDDHMIVNTLDFPRQKRVNTNPNIADEEAFSKDSSFSGKAPLNTSNYRASLLCDKLENSSVVSCSGSSSVMMGAGGGSSSPPRSSYDKSRLSHLPNSSRGGYTDYSSGASTVSSCGSASVCSSSHDNRSKEYGLPTASSIAAGAASASSKVYYSSDERQQAKVKSKYMDDNFATEV